MNLHTDQAAGLSVYEIQARFQSLRVERANAAAARAAARNR